MVRAAQIRPGNHAALYPDGDRRSAAITALNAANGGDFVETTYNAAGLTATSTDQRGVKHEYKYVDLGRLTADKVTAVPTSDHLDASIRRIERTYYEQGRLKTVTSYDAASGGSPVSGIACTYDSWGNVAASYQNHANAATTNEAVWVRGGVVKRGGADRS